MSKAVKKKRYARSRDNPLSDRCWRRFDAAWVYSYRRVINFFILMTNDTREFRETGAANLTFTRVHCFHPPCLRLGQKYFETRARVRDVRMSFHRDDSAASS
jgi:hypothetical protein